MISIYALINPMDNNVFHIGATMNTKQRIADHCSYIDESRKSKIISNILENNNRPELFVLEVVSYEEAAFYEEFYVDLFRSFGFKIRKTKSNYKGKMLSKYTLNLLQIKS